MKDRHSNNHFVIYKKATSTLIIILMLVTATFPLFSVHGYADSSEQINYFGTVLPCGKDNGYKPNTSSSWNPWTLLTLPGTIMGLIPDDDPHKGWSLGSFYVQGYSGMTESNLNSYHQNMPVYLKNAGDVVTFGFKLDQNINKLNGKSSLKIADDKQMIQDCWVEDPYVKGDFHHGILIIVYTDPQGKQTITTYRDFLKGKSVGANTEVQLFQEGDYRVILCYEIYKDTKWNWITDWTDPSGSWFDYRIESYFSVRNGNSMVFPMELESGAELTNKDFTETGFRVDLAKSRYLKLSVKKLNLNQSGTEIIEDTRFNKVIADGTEFTDEGKYIITVENLYTGLTSEKVIYVGTNDIMRCNAVTGLSVSEINTRLSNGYKITPDGTLLEPTTANIVDSPNIAPPDIDGNESNNTDIWMIIALVAISIVAICGAAFIIYIIYSRRER